MDGIYLRALDPQSDIELFHEAYNWRSHKPKLYPDKMSFEDFASTDPNQIVMGLFNGSLCAVYVINQTTNGTRETYDTHFTSRRGVPKRHVLVGAQWLLRWLLESGAFEVTAFVSERNTPLCRFVEAIGYERVGLIHFPCRDGPDSDTLPAQTKEFVKYAARSG